MQNVVPIRYRKPRKQIPSGIPVGKSVCVTTFPDILEHDIKKYLDIGYQVIVTTNNAPYVMVYMEKIL